VLVRLALRFDWDKAARAGNEATIVWTSHAFRVGFELRLDAKSSA
jgi:hypothetical protein